MSAPHIAGFMDRMTETGLGWADKRFSEPLDNGRLHRYDVEGDKVKSRNGWYVLHGGHYPAGCFGSWRAGDQFTWSFKDYKTLSPSELETVRLEREQRQKEIDQTLQVARELSRQDSLNIWCKGQYPEASFLYLVSKHLSIYGIRQYKHRLLIPVRNITGQLCSLQFISPSGDKYFKEGGRVKGCFHRIGKPRDRTIYIAEGYATAATIHELTGHAVAVAFYAGNLVDVALIIRKKYPDWQLYIAADNDRFTEGNPGLTKARKAALLTGAGLLIPTFTDDEKGSDFNDRFLLDTFPDVSND